MTARLFALPWWATCLALAGLWALASAFAVGLGAVPVPPGQLLGVLLAGGHPADPELAAVAAIIWQVRLPRVLLGGLAGLGLAVAGVAWQGVLRNPLA
ncbi:MAG: ABC-type transporter, integral rane subunit, partial [Cyanobacteria bacterium RYN_339]|nr:ABC-type transporter, integral rane subunit [Cyanobacteria bacterium RYN_339]